MDRPASLAFNLFSFWQTVPPGVRVSMDEMALAMSTADTQSIRSALTQLRKGRVPDPTARGSYLRPLPIRYNSADRGYYDLSRVSADAVLHQVPGAILAGALGQLLTRASTIDSSMGEDGLVRSARELLTDNESRMLISQLPMERIWKVQDMIGQIARARQLLELDSRSTAAIATSEA